MKMMIGSKNLAKIEALQETLQEYPLFENVEVIGISVPSNVSEQPFSLEETIRGAKNRARNAFEASPCTYGVGVESGLMEAPATRTRFLHISICSIFDGTESYIGLSTGFEVPPVILMLMASKKIDLTQACLESGISSNTQLGSQEGLIGILTNGKVDRKEYSKQAIRTALIQLDHAKWYLKEEHRELHPQTIS